jgi:hypothetical protein
MAFFMRNCEADPRQVISQGTSKAMLSVSHIISIKMHDVPQLFPSSRKQQQMLKTFLLHPSNLISFQLSRGKVTDFPSSTLCAMQS